MDNQQRSLEQRNVQRPVERRTLKRVEVEDTDSGDDMVCST
jgi:hypothetical protein